MCRYAMIAYKPHFACFHCRKTFKRRLMADIQRGEGDRTEAKCPDCGQLMANMGKDFEAPKKSDLKKWQHLQSLYTVGITFHSCGCTGPGYIPANKEDTISYLNKLKADFATELGFWRSRKEPANQQETDREQSKHFHFLYKVPKEKGKAITNQAAIAYWISKINEVDEKIDLLMLKKNGSQDKTYRLG